jgi:hypothetical protein
MTANPTAEEESMSLYVAIAVGFVVSVLLRNQDVRSLPGYEFVLYALLAVGLYGSVYGIDMHEFRNHRSLIGRAVTFGVVLKSILTGSILWLVFQTPYAFLFGIIVAQIDPLSVAHMIEGKSGKFSEGGRTILRAWSSFDDPMTVLLAIYIYLPLTVSESGAFIPESYVLQLGANLLFALLVWLLSKVATNNRIELALLGITFLVAVPFKLMLGIALVGLFLRPRFELLPRLVQISFINAAVVLGSLLEISGTSLLYGVVLGVLAFVAQAVATLLVAPRLHRTDKLFLALAQYNGITSVILALIIAQWVSQTVSVIAFAVVTINALYYGANHLLERRLRSELS